MWRLGGIFVIGGKKVVQVSDIQYFLRVESDVDDGVGNGVDEHRVPVDGPLTIGRHLDNDLLLAGEDVLDYHLRLELTDRGPWVVPLGEATLRVNGESRRDGMGLMPGDVLEIGQTPVTVQVDIVHPPEADTWRLHGQGSADGVPLGAVCRVGRGDDCDLVLHDDHVSRRHADVELHHGIVWLRDLGSANGTFVNGERVVGGCRLYHGDELRFDTARFQLIGQGADLTPARRDASEQAARLAPARLTARPGNAGDTTEFAAVESYPAVAPAPLSAEETGAFLLGASEPVTGLSFRTPMGRTLIGRGDDCDLVIRDRTVSARHAELTVRAEGVTITNLLATNGVRVNGDAVQTAKLNDGDVLRFGRVSLVFKEIPPDESMRPWLGHAQLALLIGSLILAAGLIVYLV
jgi:pSer/pThr/pTyr-binding forkhead associated (FHA) protein